MTLRRFLAALGGAGLVLAAAASPARADTPKITFTPEPPASFEVPPTISGSATHDGFNDADMSEVDLTWASEIGEPAEACTLPEPTAFTGSSTKIDFSAEPDLPCNGRYTITVKATSGSNVAHSQTTKTATRTFDVAVPPEVPAGLATSSDDVNRTVTLSWQANEEADLWGYLIDRAGADGVFAELAVTSATTYVDEQIPQAGGTFTYQVWAVRLGATQNPDDPDDFVLSDSASPASAARVTPPTTTSQRPGGGTGGGSGGARGGDGEVEGNAPPPPPELGTFERLKAEVEARRLASLTTLDPGYKDRLNYGDARMLPDDGSLAAGGARSSFADVHDRLAALRPIAIGMLLFVGALQIRYITRRAARAAGELADGPYAGDDGLSR